jgi:hypothetical protein
MVLSMKMSFSLSDDVAARLEECAKSVADGNASLLTDVALRHLLELPKDELSRIVTRRRMDRMASTRNGWNEAFWLVLGEEMGRPDTIENSYAPRNYGDFYVALLLNHVGRPDEETDPFHAYIGPRSSTPTGPRPQQWTFTRNDSPVMAAEVVAARLHELGY